MVGLSLVDNVCKVEGWFLLLLTRVEDLTWFLEEGGSELLELKVVGLNLRFKVHLVFVFEQHGP